MFSHASRHLSLTAILAGAIALAACGGGASAGSASGAASPGGSSIPPDVAAASAGAASPPANATLEVTAPKEGASLPAGNVTVTYDVGGITLASPAGSGQASDFDVAVLLDVDATPYLQQFKPVPSGDDKVVYTADKSVTFRNVAAGSHTVTVILTTGNRLSVSPPKFYKVSFQTQ